MEEKEIVMPNYYSVIPANVRYDKELSANAKLLYGEITALFNAKGFCWATNDYFSKLYNCSERTIQNLLKQLSMKKYIKITLIENSKRLIYIDFTGYEKNFVGGTKKISPPHEKIFTHNNKIEYSKINNKKNEEEEENKNYNISDDVFNYNWLD